MAKDKRESRKKLSKKVDMSKPIMPIDITKFGTDEDPCFGKLHDLTEDACKRCGDSSICSIVMNQDTLKLRAAEEKDNRFKDLELGAAKPSDKEIKNFIKKLIDKGNMRLMIRKKVMTKFGLSRDEVNKYITKIKK